jgi:hypothetical protein
MSKLQEQKTTVMHNKYLNFNKIKKESLLIKFLIPKILPKENFQNNKNNIIKVVKYKINILKTGSTKFY